MNEGVLGPQILTVMDLDPVCTILFNSLCSLRLGGFGDLIKSCVHLIYNKYISVAYHFNGSYMGINSKCFSAHWQVFGNFYKFF